MDTFFATLATNIVFWIGAIAGSLTTAAILGHGARMFLNYTEKRRMRNFDHLVRDVSRALGRIETKMTPNGGHDPKSIGTRLTIVEAEVSDVKRILIGALKEGGYYQDEHKIEHEPHPH